MIAMINEISTVFHEAANAFPLMDDQRLKELTDDIRANGLREPITLCDGRVLDGRNRVKACQALGIMPAYRRYDGDPWAYVWSLNGERRDLVADQRYLIWRFCHEKSEAFQAEQQRIQDEANRKRSEAAKQRERNPDGTLASTGTVCASTRNDKKGQQAKAQASKTNRGAVARGDKLAKHRPDLAEKVRTGEMKPAEAHKQMRRDEREARERQALATVAVRPWKITDDVSIVRCQALITDPPYGILDEPWEPEELERFTREWAGRWNVCGADLVAIFFSQQWVWDARRWFDESLTSYSFQQLLVWHYPNNKSPQSRMGFKQTWEPVFLYRLYGSVKQIQLHGGAWGDGLNDFDCHVAAVPQSNFSDENAKVHPAQKPVSVMAWLVNALTVPGELVVDPFCGSGTTGIAAAQLGRTFHGIELNREYREAAEGRIAAYGKCKTSVRCSAGGRVSKEDEAGGDSDL